MKKIIVQIGMNLNMSLSSLHYADSHDARQSAFYTFYTRNWWK